MKRYRCSRYDVTASPDDLRPLNTNVDAPIAHTIGTFLLELDRDDDYEPRELARDFCCIPSVVEVDEEAQRWEHLLGVELV